MSEKTNVEEAIGLLADGGVLTRLKDEAQSEREAQRAGLLVQLASLEKRLAEDGAQAEKKRAALVQRITALEAQLNEARADLRKIEVPDSFSIEKLRGKLRRLADPRFAVAIRQLSDLSDKARHQFAAREQRVRTILGVRRAIASNALEIADILAACRRVQLEFEAMQEAARPDDLDSVIAAKVDPIRQAVRDLHGL